MIEKVLYKLLSWLETMQVTLAQGLKSQWEMSRYVT